MSILMDVATSSKKIYEKKFKLNRQTRRLDILLILVSYMSICLKYKKYMKSKTSMQYLIAVCCASHYIFDHNNYLVCINIKGSYGMIILFVNDDPVFGCQDSLCGFTAQFIRCFCTICFFSGSWYS